MIVTIDGPAGTGKTTVAKKVAGSLGLPYFDTGAMYRSVALLMIQRGMAPTDISKIGEFLKAFSFEIKEREGHNRYFANGQDVTEAIRSAAVTQMVSAVAALAPVRQAIWKIQRSRAKKKGGVFEGRDMGSVVFPSAEIKIFLTARPEVRAQRRLDEIIAKRPEEAEGMDRQKMLEEIARRDDADSTRALAPLVCPPDAYVIDTSELSIDEVVARIVEYKTKKAACPAWMQMRPIKLLYRLVIFLAWFFAKLLYRHKVYGLEHYYPRGAIIAANHASHLDPPLVSISWPEEVHFLARESLFRPFGFGALIRALNSHPVSGKAGDAAVFRTICNLLEEGKKVILFPEGTRTADGNLGPVKPGIGMLVLRSKAAVIPTYLFGTYKLWSRHRRFPKLFGKTACVFGSPICFEEFSHLDKKEAQEAIGKRLEAAILALKKWLEDGAKGIPP